MGIFHNIIGVPFNLKGLTLTLLGWTSVRVDNALPAGVSCLGLFRLDHIVQTARLAFESSWSFTVSNLKCVEPSIKVLLLEGLLFLWLHILSPACPTKHHPNFIS